MPGWIEVSVVVIYSLFIILLVVGFGLGMIPGYLVVICWILPAVVIGLFAPFL